MRGWIGVAALSLGAVAQPALAAPAVTDGVLGRFVGAWTVSGTTRGEPTATGAEIEALFGGAFLELHIKDPQGKSRYEARVFFGRADDGALVIHWLDATGGDTSRTLGTGRVEGDVVTFAFAYPDGAFRDRLSYDRAHDRWRLLIEMGPADHPATFSDWYFDRETAR